MYERNEVQILAHLPPRKRKAASLAILSLFSILKFICPSVFVERVLTSDDTGRRHLLFNENMQHAVLILYQY